MLGTMVHLIHGAESGRKNMEILIRDLGGKTVMAGSKTGEIAAKRRMPR